MLKLYILCENKSDLATKPKSNSKNDTKSIRYDEKFTIAMSINREVQLLFKHRASNRPKLFSTLADKNCEMFLFQLQKELQFHFQCF